MDRKYCGVDLHKRSFTVCWMDEKGKKSKTETYSTNEKGYANFKKKLSKKVEVAVELSGNTGFFYDSIVKEVKKITVINPRKFKVVRISNKEWCARCRNNSRIFKEGYIARNQNEK